MVRRAQLKILVLTISLGAVRASAQEPGQPAVNLFQNQDFETGIDSCVGAKRRIVGPDAGDDIGKVEYVAAPEMISRNVGDTWATSAGALRITIAKQPGFEYYSHDCGVICTLRAPVRPGSIIRVEFSAKSLTGAAWISISRKHGGAHANIQVSREWKRYVAFVSNPDIVGWDVSEFVFSLVPGDSDSLQVLADGVLLVDAVSGCFKEVVA
jgi:hypothetical protein